MRTIAVLNQKGGVGKTTTVTNTAAALARMGARVLVMDLDPQAHLTIHLGVEPDGAKPGSYEILTQSADIKDAIRQVRDNLFLVGTNVNLVGAESELVSVVGREVILSEAVESIENDYDYLLIDCAPSLGLLTLNALAAVKEVLIPLQPHFLALQGFGKLLQTVEIVNRRINPGLKVSGILLCMYDSRALLPSEVKADIEQFLRDARGTRSAWSEARIIPRLIRRNIKLAEAPSYGKTIFEYEPGCNGAEDYTAVAHYIHKQTLAAAGMPAEQIEVVINGQQPTESSKPVETPETPEPTPAEAPAQTVETPSTPAAGPAEAPKPAPRVVEVPRPQKPAPQTVRPVAPQPTSKAPTRPATQQLAPVRRVEPGQTPAYSTTPKPRPAAARAAAQAPQRPQPTAARPAATPTRPQAVRPVAQNPAAPIARPTTTPSGTAPQAQNRAQQPQRNPNASPQARRPVATRPPIPNGRRVPPQQIIPTRPAVAPQRPVVPQPQRTVPNNTQPITPTEIRAIPNPNQVRRPADVDAPTGDTVAPRNTESPAGPQQTGNQ